MAANMIGELLGRKGRSDMNLGTESANAARSWSGVNVEKLAANQLHISDGQDPAYLEVCQRLKLNPKGMLRAVGIAKISQLILTGEMRRREQPDLDYQEMVDYLQGQGMSQAEAEARVKQGCVEFLQMLFSDDENNEQK
jgi:hypothetical protein